MEQPRGFSSQSQNQTASDDAESSSAKALKAAADVALTSGTYRIGAADDAIHGNADVAIMVGEYNLASGDDGAGAGGGGESATLMEKLPLLEIGLAFANGLQSRYFPEMSHLKFLTDTSALKWPIFASFPLIWSK